VTSVDTYFGQVQRLENWTLRYPGHAEWFKAFRTLGLFEEEPIQVGDQTVIPREVFHTLLAPHISAPLIKDVCILRGEGRGIKEGKETEITIDLLDYYDEDTGFTSMERLTGWHVAIMMGFQAKGAVPAGATSLEKAIKASTFMEALKERGIEYTVDIQ
jgi:lysine 6-dehydrogenase